MGTVLFDKALTCGSILALQKLTKILKKYYCKVFTPRHSSGSDRVCCKIDDLPSQYWTTVSDVNSLFSQRTFLSRLLCVSLPPFNRQWRRLVLSLCVELTLLTVSNVRVFQLHLKPSFSSQSMDRVKMTFDCSWLPNTGQCTIEGNICDRKIQSNLLLAANLQTE